MKKQITVEYCLRRIERECRENIKAFGSDYKPNLRDGRFAMAEARATCQTCDEFKRTCRDLRKLAQLEKGVGKI